ncbi:MAG: DUF4080 domain-containing protein, partial [Candidatus Electrothrix sp. AR3]|nr:DUF4080 domain-containing protein [Candidatus Electrothrix sp. AR3]
PGTIMELRAKEFGLIYCNKPPYEVLATKWLHHGQLSALYAFCECVETFYNNRFFRSLWHYLLQTDKEPYTFFQQLFALCRRHNFFDLARTHKLMNQMLVELAKEYQDGEVLLELLRYDWLRCGYRNLPDYLEQTAQPELRNRLRQELPQSMDGIFSSGSRINFLKKATFLELSAKAMHLLHLGDTGPALLAFVPEQSSGVMKFNQVILLSIE